MYKLRAEIGAEQPATLPMQCHLKKISDEYEAVQLRHVRGVRGP